MPRRSKTTVDQKKQAIDPKAFSRGNLSYMLNAIMTTKPDSVSYGDIAETLESVLDGNVYHQGYQSRKMLDHFKIELNNVPNVILRFNMVRNHPRVVSAEYITSGYSPNKAPTTKELTAIRSELFKALEWKTNKD